MEQEATNNLILGILSAIIAGGYANTTPYLACVEDNDDIVLVALRTPPHNILLSTAKTLDSIPVIVQHLYQTYTTLPGLSAVDEMADRFVAEWQNTSGQSHQLKMHQGIYQLETIQPIPLPQGELHPVRDVDEAIIIEWFQTFMSGISGVVSPKVAEANFRKITQQPANQAGLYVWMVDGEPVTMAAYLGGTPNGYRVSYVYTPPVHRRNGYATACTAGVSQRALDMGATYCFLYTDLSNPTSNHIYQVIGYEWVCSVKQYRFD